MLADVHCNSLLVADTRSKTAVLCTDLKRNMQCEFWLDIIKWCLSCNVKDKKMTCDSW